MAFLAGQLVREARLRAGLTQRELAARLATTQSAVARWERATTDMGVDRLQEALHACGYDLIPLVDVYDTGDVSLLARFGPMSPAQRSAWHEDVAGQFAGLRTGGVVTRPPQFSALFEVLARHEVHYVLIGGFAAVLAGSPFPTEDIDITPERSMANLARLSAALTEINARIRIPDGQSLAFSHDATSLASMAMLNLDTDLGYLDLAMQPSGTQGYDDLRVAAEQTEVHGIVVTVAALADVIRSKEAAGRDKDRRVLPVLREILRRQVRG